jgi:hypothetical protein
VSASGGAEIIGVDGITIRADVLGIEVNGGKNHLGVAESLNLAASPSFLATGGGGPDRQDPDGAGDLPAPSRTLAFTGNLLRATGSVTMAIDNFVYVSGNFEFTKSTTPQTIVLTNGTSKVVSVLTVGASHVNAFVGTGNPDSNDDGRFDGTDNPAANGAIGLALTNLDFGLALFKPIAVADRSSYYALQATALNDQVSGGTGGIRLVGVPGVSLSANNLSVTINGASAPTTGGATPTGPPAPVIDFKAAGSTFGTAGFSVGIGGGDSILLDLRARTIAASGDVTLGLDFDTDGTADITLSSFISFQQSFRPNGSSVIKIALTDLSFVLGDPSRPGLLAQRPQWPVPDHAAGHGGPHRLPGYSTTINGSSASISISGNLAVEINTTNAVVNETFVTGRQWRDDHAVAAEGSVPAAVRLPVAGHHLRGCVVSVPFVLSGNFAFEQITLVDPNPGDNIAAPKAIRVAVSDVTATVQGVGLTNGQGGFIFSPDGMAGVLRVTIDASTGDPGVPSLGGDVLLQINTTGRAVNQTIAVGNTVIAIKFTAQEGRVVRFAILNASVSIRRSSN